MYLKSIKVRLDTYDKFYIILWWPCCQNNKFQIDYYSVSKRSILRVLAFSLGTSLFMAIFKFYGLVKKILQLNVFETFSSNSQGKIKTVYGCILIFLLVIIFMFIKLSVKKVWCTEKFLKCTNNIFDWDFVVYYFISNPIGRIVRTIITTQLISCNKCVYYVRHNLFLLKNLFQTTFILIVFFGVY